MKFMKKTIRMNIKYRSLKAFSPKKSINSAPNLKNISNSISPNLALPL